MARSPDSSSLLPVQLYCSCTQPTVPCLAGIFEAGSVRLGERFRKTWRVVFSSSGDLVPESGAAHSHRLRTYAWLETALFPLRVVADSLAAILVPSDCRICDYPLVRLSKIPVCEPCLSSVRLSEVVSCGLCGEALDFLSPEAPAICPLCRRVPPRFDFAISFGGYDGALRGLLHLLKYEHLRPAAKILGGKLAEAMKPWGFEGDRPVLVIPVPLHRSKRRQRGFNQSELIARSALKVLPSFRFELHIGNLRRTRATVSQTGLTRHQRRENVRGAFVVEAPEQVKGRSVLIVDDVYTTGTTLNECARVLRAAGAKQVVVATVARVYRPTAELIVGGVPRQEENAAVLAANAASAVAG